MQDTHLQLVVRFRKREERGRRDELLVQPSAKSFVNATSAGVTKLKEDVSRLQACQKKGISALFKKDACMYVGLCANSVGAHVGSEHSIRF